MYIYKECVVLETFDHPPTDADLEAHEDGFNDGYNDFRMCLPLVYEMREEEAIWRVDSFEATLVAPEDLWYAFGVIQGWEQAQEDAVTARKRS